MKSRIMGRVWRFGDNVDTDQIIPAEYLVSADNRFLAAHAFEKTRPEFTKAVKRGDIIVGGKNFGCGSSREHAPKALIGLGISCVIAESFARIFYRNSINLGLPLVECKVSSREGDTVEVDFKNGVIHDISNRKDYGFKPMPDFLAKLMDGGLIPYVKSQLRK